MRVKKLGFSHAILLTLGSGRFEVTDNPLPPDARVRDVRHGGAVVWLYVESAAFEEVPDAQEPPEVAAPVIRRLEV
jgi:hypothetical protein